MSRPGIESILIPRAGIAQEWITSIEEVRIRIGNLNGKMQRLSTSRSRNSLGKSWSVGIMNESKSIFVKSEYSYLQYHWWPRAFTVRLTLKISSVRYRTLIEGIAMEIRINMGRIVHTISIVWFSSKNRWINWLDISLSVINRIRIVIKVKMIIAKSWKKIIKSYVGELESWREINHVLIFNKR